MCVPNSDPPVKISQIQPCLTYTIISIRRLLDEGNEEDIPRVSWTTKKQMSGSSTKLELRKELLKTVKTKKLAYYGHTTRKQGSCLEKEIMQGTMPGACRRGRPRTAWMDNIKTWTGFTMEESIRMAEDRDKWRKYVHGCGQPSDGGRLKNRTEHQHHHHHHRVYL